MRSWFIWNGICSADMGISIERIPDIPRPERNIDRVTIPGRDGELTTSDDTYKPVTFMLSCAVTGNEMLDELAGWLQGAGELILSINPGKAYRARIDNDFTFAAAGRLFRKFELVFIAQPFKYEAQPQTIELTASGSIHNPGTRWSLPVITVYGAGTLTVGDYEIIVEATGGEDSVTINSEIEECYYGDENRNDKVSGLSAGFVKLQPGATEIVIGGGITSIKIQGNWRWF